MRVVSQIAGLGRHRDVGGRIGRGIGSESCNSLTVFLDSQYGVVDGGDLRFVEYLTRSALRIPVGVHLRGNVCKGDVVRVVGKRTHRRRLVENLTHTRCGVPVALHLSGRDRRLVLDEGIAVLVGLIPVGLHVHLSTGSYSVKLILQRRGEVVVSMHIAGILNQICRLVLDKRIAVRGGLIPVGLYVHLRASGYAVKFVLQRSSEVVVSMHVAGIHRIMRVVCQIAGLGRHRDVGCRIGRSISSKRRHICAILLDSQRGVVHRNVGGCIGRLVSGECLYIGTVFLDGECGVVDGGDGRFVVQIVVAARGGDSGEIGCSY